MNYYYYELLLIVSLVLESILKRKCRDLNDSGMKNLLAIHNNFRRVAV